MRSPCRQRCALNWRTWPAQAKWHGRRHADVLARLAAYFSGDDSPGSCHRTLALVSTPYVSSGALTSQGPRPKGRLRLRQPVLFLQSRLTTDASIAARRQTLTRRFSLSVPRSGMNLLRPDLTTKLRRSCPLSPMLRRRPMERRIKRLGRHESRDRCPCYERLERSAATPMRIFAEAIRRAPLSLRHAVISMDGSDPTSRPCTLSTKAAAKRNERIHVPGRATNLKASDRHGSAPINLPYVESIRALIGPAIALTPEIETQPSCADLRQRAPQLAVSSCNSPRSAGCVKTARRL